METIQYMTVEQAQTELVTINAAINEYYTGTRRVRLTIWSAGNKRDYQFSDPNKLFEYLVKRRDELVKFISESLSSSSAVPAFTKNSNIPLVFRR